MSRQLYSDLGVRDAAREVRGRNKGVARAVKERKRIEAEERQDYFEVRPLESQLNTRRAIVEKQPDRYQIFNSGSPRNAVMIRVDLDARDFSYDLTRKLGL